MEQKTKKGLEIAIFSFLGLIAIVSLSLFFYQYAYANKIYPNVKVANIDLSGKNKAQASAILEKKYNSILDNEFTLKTEQGSIKTKVRDTGLSLNLTKTTEDCYKIGRDKSFFKQIYFSVQTLWKNETVSVEPQIDRTKYDQFLKIAVAQLNTEPKNASLTIENGELKKVEETSGTVVDTKNLIDRILTLANDDLNKTVSLNTNPILPTIKAADFEPATQFAGNILNRKVTFIYQDKVYSPSKSDLGLWITFIPKDGKYYGSLNENNIQAYLNKIAKNFEIQKVDKKINASDNAVIDPGRQGLYLDKNDTIAQIKSQIAIPEQDINITLKTYTVDPSEVKIFPSEGLIPGRFEGKYIDVDLTLQKLCQVEGNTVIACYIISSGKPGMPTPTGTYHVTNKSPRQYSSKYGLYMPWWEQFNGDYGIHELPETATWKEVPDHLGTPISHGCVRLGVGPAKTVYDWSEIGTPVYIHK